MESALGEGGTRLMCSVGKDVMGMDQFGNPDGRLVVNADVPIADHGTWSASATSVFRQPQAWQYARTLPCSSRCTRLRNLYRDRCSDALSCLLWSDARSRTDDQQPALLSLRPVIAQSTAERG
jgi:hypothetical protein